MRTSAKLIEAMRARGLVTVPEAAAIAMVATTTVRRWCKAERVASKLRGSMLFVDLASLKRWIGGQQQEDAQ